MAKLTFENKEYDLDSLSPETRNLVAMARAAEGKLMELQRDMAIARTAAGAYQQALRAALAKQDT